MSDRRHWILDPEGHRRLQNAQAAGAPSTAEFLGEQVEVFYMTGPPDDWVCDLCNDTIHTRHKLRKDDLTVCRCGRQQCPLLGQALVVPADGGNAYCRACYEKLGGEAAWPTTEVCGCSACLVQAEDWGYRIDQ